MTRTILKKKRHEYLLRKIKQNPFLKDEELAQACNVSVSTIRFDRAELGIAEYRERIKSVAEEGLVADTAVGEVLDLNLYHDGISVLKTDDTMTFDGTDIIKGQCIYASFLHCFHLSLRLCPLHCDGSILFLLLYLSIQDRGSFDGVPPFF